MPPPAIELFFSCAREDEALRRELEKHLAGLQRDHGVTLWHDGLVGPGEDRDDIVARRLRRAQVILLLVSADYLASDARCEAEVELALDRHGAGAARVIPVVLRECDWRGAPFGKLEPLPHGGAAVTSAPNRDAAWAEVARGIRGAIARLQGDAPRPRYADAASRALAEQLEAARERRLALVAAGFPTAEVDREILDLRRRLRDGGQLRPGDELGDGRYLLLEPIGRGGFGTVWRAFDRTRAALVAIKVLHGNLAGDPLRRERFHRGARAMAALEHEAVARVLDPAGEDAGYHYFVMELLPGGDLRRAVLDGRMPKDRVLHLILRIGDALAAAHDRGLVHRDVKPENILLDAAGDPRLTDFDLVADPGSTGGTRTGPLGSVLYAPPELMSRPQDADARADVYSLGMTAVFGLHGEDLPFDVIRDAAPLIDGLPCGEAIRAALKRAVEWNLERRFPAVRAFCEALREALAAADPAPAAPTSVRPTGGRLSLEGRDLRGVDWSRKNLRGAALRGADLTGAALVRADLTGADLRGARLARATLQRATLAEAKLGQADLSFARLLGADLTGAELAGTRLRYAALVGARVELVGANPDRLFGAALPGSAPELALAAPPSRCLTVAVSPDGAILASGHADGSLRLRSALSAIDLRVLTGGSPALSLAFSPDGRTLACGLMDASIQLWDLPSGALIGHLRGHAAEVLSLAVSPDGTWLASGSADGAFHFYDLTHGSASRLSAHHAGPVRCVAFSPDGRMLASGGADGAVWLWTKQRGWLIDAVLPHADAIGSLAFSPDGQLLAAGTSDGAVQLWDVPARAELHLLAGHSGGVWNASFSADGAVLATCAQDDTLRFWDVQTGFELRVLSARERAASPDVASNGAAALPIGAETMVPRWSAMVSAVQSASADGRRAVISVAFSPDGEQLATGEAHGTVRTWNLVTGEATRVLEKSDGPPRLVAFSPSGVRAVSGPAAKVVAVSPDRTTQANGHPDGSIQLTRPQSGSVSFMDLEGHRAAVRCLDFTPDGKLLASGSEDRTLRLWDASTGELRRTCVGHTHSVLGVAFSPDGQTLASASADSTVRLWNLASPEADAARTLTGHMAAVASVAFHPSGATLASASHDGTVRIWDLDGRCLAILLPLPQGWAALTSDGRYRLHGPAAGAFWHVVGLCRFEPGDLDSFLSTPLRIPDGEPLFSRPL